jgi:sterol desaturase/sphingolipid hydroxylase (fatty acid hydroxylase superfamily)
MGTKVVSNRDETVRMFENPVLEYFSHIHPATPVVVFVPIIAWRAVAAFTSTTMLQTAVVMLAGIVLWTLVEYTIHRFVFHIEPKTEWGKRIHFMVHGVHHDYPRDSTRLVMPLLVSVPLAALFYVAFQLMVTPFHDALFSGFLTGYVAYDVIHYATHHWPMKGPVGRFLKEYHMKHHYVDDHTAYGVSSPLWDVLLGTLPQWVQKRTQSLSNRT